MTARRFYGDTVVKANRGGSAMKIAAVVGVMALGFTAADAASNQYLCITESMGGLHYDAKTQSWRPQAFKADGKYVLRRINDDDRRRWGALLKKPNWAALKKPGALPVPEEIDVVGDWAFFRFEDNRPLMGCKEERVELIFCEETLPRGDGPSILDIDLGYTGSRRFEIVYRGGYIFQGFAERYKRPSDEPFQPADLAIEVGKCSPF